MFYFLFLCYLLIQLVSNDTLCRQPGERFARTTRTGQHFARTGRIALHFESAAQHKKHQVPPIVADSPGTCKANLRLSHSSELIPSTLYSVLHELPRDKERLRERTVFWDFDADTNVMPLRDVEGGWWFASWDLKVSPSPCRTTLTDCH